MNGRRRPPGEENRKALRTGLPARAEYAVGYGKPPVETRFRPGISGNPAGRRKGSRNKTPALNEERMKGIILEEAYRTIRVRDGERSISVPVAQAVIRSLAVNAAKGNHRAQRLFAELLAATETANKRLYDDYLETAITYKVEWDRELERRKQFGTTGSEPLPHPDHIEIDMRTGSVRIKGPMTSEEKNWYEEWRARKADFESELASLRQELADDPDTEYRQIIEAEIAQTEKVLDIIRRAIPD